jgi:BMFP domain-containing protein YqiC
MDTVAALGLAANIIQFISFSHELLSSAQEVWSSASGTTREVEHLKLLVADIQHSSKDARDSVLSDGHQDKHLLRKIALECQNLADALVKKLSKLEAKKTGLARQFEAISIAGRSRRARDEIVGMKMRLFELEARLRQWWESENQRCAVTTQPVHRHQEPAVY